MAEATKDLIKTALEELIAEGKMNGVIDRMHDSQEKALDKKSDYVKLLMGGFMPTADIGAQAKAKEKRIGSFLMTLALAKGQLHVAREITKTMNNDVLTKDMGEATAVGGGILVSPAIAEGVIELLRAKSVIYKMGALEVPMPNGQMSFPKLTTGATSTYSGEGVTQTAADLAFGNVNLASKELSSYVTVANGLLYDTSGRAEMIITTDMVQSITSKMDLTAFRGNGAENTPKGIRYLVDSTMLLAANTTGSTTADKIKIDLKELVTAVLTADIPMTRPGFVLSPRTNEEIYSTTATTGQYIYKDEMNAGKLSRYPVDMTSNIPINLDGANTEIYFGDFAQLLVGVTGGMELDFSTDIKFMANQTVFRALNRHDFGLRHAKAFAVKTGITY